MGRSGRDAQMCERCREVERHGDVEQVVPNPYVMDKNQEGYPRSERSQPQTTQPRVPEPRR